MNPCSFPGGSISNGTLNEIRVEPLRWVMRDPKMFEISTGIRRIHWILGTSIVISVKSLLGFHNLSTVGFCEEYISAIPFSDEVPQVSLIIVDSIGNATNNTFRAERCDRIE